jgi:hypothetical protein
MKENNVMREKSSFVKGKVDKNAEDSALTKDESVCVEYNTVKPNVTARLNEIELVSPKAWDPKKSEANGIHDAIRLNKATVILSNLAILNALFVNSRSLWPSSSKWLFPKAPHHMRPLSWAIDLYTDSP